MRQILLQLEKFFPLLRNTTLPALLFGLSLLGFYACQPLATPSLLNLHHLFYAFALLEGLCYGFGIWWLNYCYVWAILYGIARALRRRESSFFWAVASGAFGGFAHPFAS